jgi:regulator of sigma E protease
MSALLFLLILLLLVIVHEYGHFLVAKFFGIRVDEFGVGYPPKAFSFGTWRGTEYTLNWLPFGGFVKIYGEDGDGATAAEKKVSLAFKPWWAQVLVLGAGVVANAVLAWLLFAYAAAHGAPIAVGEQSSLKQSAEVVVTRVLPESPASLAGLMPDDRIIAVRSKGDVLTDVVPTRITAFVQAHAGDELEFTVAKKTTGLEDAPRAVRSVTIIPVQGLTANKTKAAIGVEMGFLLQGTVSPLAALHLGALETWRWLGDTAYGMVHLFTGMFSGASSLNDISGPVGIAGQVGNWYNLGFAYLAYFAAIISVNLAIINLLPLPALDGGRIVFVLIEAVTRRRLPAVVASSVNTVGFVLLIALMLVVTWGDISKLLA